MSCTQSGHPLFYSILETLEMARVDLLASVPRSDTLLLFDQMFHMIMNHLSL